MIIQASADLARRELGADVVIIGAGPAGLAVASRVAAAGGRALVLESGGYEPEPDRDAGRASAAGNLPYFDLSDCRPRGLGGSTTLWGGWCEPFDAFDLETRSISDETGWCVSAAALEPYYDRSLVFCGIPKVMPKRQWGRADELRSGDWPFELREFAVLGPRQLGYSHAHLFIDGALDLVLGATVTHIGTTAGGTVVDHLVAATPAGHVVVSGNRFVLAAGGIETARLLLCSSSKAWPTGAGNEHDLVGRCFMEHPHVDAMRLRGDPALFDLDYFQERKAGTALDGKPMAAAGCLLLSEAGCRTHQVARVQLFIERAGGHRQHELPRLWNGRRLQLPARDVGTDEFAVIVATEQVPNRSSRIVLGDIRDAHGMPLPILEWKLNETDHRTAVTGVELLRPFLIHLGARDLRRRMQQDRWPLDTLGAPHHLGTARMARSSRDGVVNEHCRIHDMKNLFVAGGAVFPTAGHAPPTLTIIALALRLGDHLARHSEDAGFTTDHLLTEDAEDAVQPPTGEGDSKDGAVRNHLSEVG